MSSLLDFADAVRPARHVILNLLMADYSIGHEILLLRQRNPIMFVDFDSIDVAQKHEAIQRAALVCSRTWRQNKKPDKWIKPWLLRNRFFADFEKEIKAFQKYRREGTNHPHLNKPSREGRMLGSSSLARMINFAYPRFDESTYDLPFGYLQHLYFADAESNGHCEVENDEDRELREQIEKYQADYEREQLEKELKKNAAA